MLQQEEIKQNIESALFQSVSETISTVFSLTPEVAEGKQNDYDVICSIGFVGCLEGHILMTFSVAGACFFVSKMLDDEITAPNSDVVDGLGEILNMVAGGIKTRMASTGCSFDISVPTVIQGEGMKLRSGDDVSIVQTGFICEKFFFNTIIAYKIHTDDVVDPPKDALPKSNIDAQNVLEKLVSENHTDKNSDC